MIAFALVSIGFVCASLTLGLYLGYGYGRERGYRDGRWDGIEEGYANALRDLRHAGRTP